ncbi:MAG: hypothetical protein QOE29_733 [Gaiellaceae bacterium]|nr:hypothetical protein [Gaiellaceae bacterium]
MTRDIFVSTAALAEPRELWAILDALEAAGIDRVELGHCRVPERDRAALLGRLQRRSERFLVHNYFPPFAGDLVLNLASNDPAIAGGSLAFALEALELCAALEAPFYSIHSGFITDPIGFDGTSFILPPPQPGAREETAARFVENLGTVVQRAAALGLSVLVENSVCTEELAGKLLLLEAEELLELFAAIAAPNLGLLLDTGHLSVTAQTEGFDALRYVDLVAPHVQAFHAHQNGGAADTHDPVGEGWVLDTLRRPELAAKPIIVEAKLRDADAAAAHVSWLDAAASPVRSGS